MDNKRNESVTDREIGPVGGRQKRFGPRRMTDQALAGQYLGEFLFAGTKLKIYQREDKSLYAAVPSGQMPIQLCEDGKVVVGKAPPAPISPSLQSALARR